jgi:hypothetical protein
VIVGTSTPSLVIATCPFPTSADPGDNGRFVLRQMRYAREHGAHVPEACLSGYAGADLPTYQDFDSGLLERTARRVQELAAELGLWVVVGSAHRLTGVPYRPRMSPCYPGSSRASPRAPSASSCGSAGRGRTR